jgi:hypothetical protein
MLYLQPGRVGGYLWGKQVGSVAKGAPKWPGGRLASHVVGRPDHSMQLTPRKRNIPPWPIRIIPAKFPRIWTDLKVDQPPIEPIGALACPTTSPPIVDPITLVKFKLLENIHGFLPMKMLSLHSMYLKR